METIIELAVKQIDIIGLIENTKKKKPQKQADNKKTKNH